MESKHLLEQVIEENLKTAKEWSPESEEHKKAFKEAMEAIDRCIELDKMEDKRREQKEAKLVKYIEVIAVPVSLVLLKGAFEFATKWYFAKKVCNFEKEYTFTTTPGRSISSWFKW